MNEDLVNLGALIKAKREERSLSLKEVENSTSIRKTYLEAIENGRVYEFISGVYGQGFLRQYLEFLNLNHEEMLEEYPKAFQCPKEKQEFSYGIGSLEVRHSDNGGSRLLPNLLWATLAGVVLLGAWLLIKYLGLL